MIPNHAPVANAVGAIAGGVVQRRRVLIHHLEDLQRSLFRVYLPDGNRDFDDLEQAVAYTQKVMSLRLEERAREAGADHVEVNMVRHDQRVPTGRGAEDELYLGTELRFTATGRPGLAQKGKHL